MEDSEKLVHETQEFEVAAAFSWVLREPEILKSWIPCGWCFLLIPCILNIHTILLLLGHRVVRITEMHVAVELNSESLAKALLDGVIMRHSMGIHVVEGGNT